MNDATAISRDGRCVLRRIGEVDCLDLHADRWVRLEGVSNIRTLGDSSCYVTTDGGVRCIDADDHAFTVPGLHDVIAVTDAAGSACAVRKNGSVACGPHTDHGRWLQVAGLDHVSELVLASDRDGLHECATVGPVARCFDLDLANADGSALAPHVVKIAPVDELAGASQLVMAVDVDPERFGRVVDGIVAGGIVVVTWMNERSVSHVPAKLEPIPALANVRDVATSYYQTCAVHGRGTVTCWRGSSPAEVVIGSGDGSVALSAAPIGVPGL